LGVEFLVLVHNKNGTQNYATGKTSCTPFSLSYCFLQIIAKLKNREYSMMRIKLHKKNQKPKKPKFGLLRFSGF